MKSTRLGFSEKASVLIAGLVFAAPLFFLTNIYDTYDLPKLMLVEWADLGLVILWLEDAFSRGTLRFHRSVLDIPLLGFLSAGLLSALFSIDPSLSFWGSYRTYIFGWVPTLSFALLYWLTVQAAGPVLLRRVYWAALLSGTCVGVYALLQYNGLEIFSEIPSAQGARVWSSLGNPVYVGALCMMALPLALSWWNAGSGTAFFLILGGLLISFSRSAWVGTGVAACWIAWTMRRKMHWKGSKIAGVLAVAAMIAAFPGVLGRARSILSVRDSSNASRIEGWKGGLRIWKTHPWLGTGPDTFFQAFRPFRTEKYIQVTGPYTTQGHAHNELIQVAATQGIAGTVFYLWILAVLVRRFCKGAWPGEGRTLGFAAALVALWVQDQFNFSAVSTSAWAAVFTGILLSPADSVVWSSKLPPTGRWGKVALAGLAAAGLWKISVPLRADWEYKQGREWSQGGQYAAALQRFREAVRLNGRIEVYESDEANAARSAGQMDEAWAAAESLVRRHPHNPDAWNNRGVAAMWMIQLAHEDRWQDALSSFQRAIELDPVFVDAWANVAKYRHLKGELDEEKKVWRHVLELDPQHVMARQVLGLR